MVSYLEELIDNGYNRYAYEGVIRQIKERVKKLLAQKEQRRRKKSINDE